MTVGVQGSHGWSSAQSIARTSHCTLVFLRSSGWCIDTHPLTLRAVAASEIRSGAVRGGLVMRSRRTGVALLSITLAVSLASLGAHTHVAPAAGARDVPLGRPATVWVDDDWTSGSCGGHTWQVDAFKVIQNGIDGVAASGGTVIVYPGTYTENIDFKGKAITVRSMEPLEPGAVNLTIIDGNDAGSVVTFDSGETSSSQLIGFTVRNGQAAEGAGIYCNLSSPTISSNVITLNDAVSGTGYAYGGGIYCWASSPDIIGNDVGGNMADRDGGGIYCENVSSPTISDNEIYYNTAGYAGGGIYCDSSSPAITGNNIYYNDAYEAGGGIACLDSASPTIAGNDIHHNGAVVSPDDPPDWCRYGGGIYCTSSSPMITGNQIRHNVVEGRGGGSAAQALPRQPSQATRSTTTRRGFRGPTPTR